MRAVLIRKAICLLIGHTSVCEPYRKITHHENGMHTDEIKYIRRCIVCGRHL
jgi:hypothetical protein